ncbi:MAG: carbohydrate ABC transporter permease [Defluviitaleaceae bacterium]|nr:carbohydrate ABC transporter permease [Defluviitaleaceae bacterium]
MIRKAKTKTSSGTSAKVTVARMRRERLIHGTMDGYYLKNQAKSIVGNILFYSLVVGLSFAILYPLIRVLPVVFSEFRYLNDPDVIWVPIQFSMLSFRAAIRVGFGNFTNMGLTLVYAAVIAIVQIVISAMAGYSLGRVKFPGQTMVMIFVFMVIIVPPPALLIPQFLRFAQFEVLGIVGLFNNGQPLNLLNNQATLFILSFTGFGVKQAIFIFIFRQFFKGLPLELEEAALIDGCGFYKTFVRIAFPMAVPAIVTVFALAFVWNYGDTYLTGYFHPDGPYLANSLDLLFQYQNMEHLNNFIVRIYNLPFSTSFMFDAIKHAAALVYLAPLLLMYFISQRRIVENFERAGIVG